MERIAEECWSLADEGRGDEDEDEEEDEEEVEGSRISQSSIFPDRVPAMRMWWSLKLSFMRSLVPSCSEWRAVGYRQSEVSISITLEGVASAARDDTPSPATSPAG